MTTLVHILVIKPLRGNPEPGPLAPGIYIRSLTPQQATGNALAVAVQNLVLWARSEMFDYADANNG